MDALVRLPGAGGSSHQGPGTNFTGTNFTEAREGFRTLMSCTSTPVGGALAMAIVCGSGVQALGAERGRIGYGGSGVAWADCRELGNESRTGAQSIRLLPVGVRSWERE